MSASSYLELYLAIFGWYMYDVIWGVLRDVSIAYMPFIGMFIRNIASPVKSQEAKDAAGTSLRRIEIDLLSMVLVITLAVLPVYTLTFKGLNYIKACSHVAGSVTAVKPGATGTTYDSIFTTATLGGGTAKVPLWWYGVMAISGGINNAIIVKIPCDADIRMMSYKLNNTKIKIPRLRREAQKFYNDCYAPSISDYLEKDYTASAADPNDVTWMGSKHLIDHYYGERRAKSEVPGYLYNPSRDLEYDSRVYIPTFGKPTCKEWWEGGSSSPGVRAKLLGQIETTFMTDFKTLLARAGKTKTESENIALRDLVTAEESSLRSYERVNYYGGSGGTNALIGTAAAAGALLESVSYFPTIYLIKMAAPMIQAALLMLIYMLLPFILVFSSYNIGLMIFMSIVIFSIKFWTVLWAVVHWLDNHLLVALRPSNWWEMGTSLANNNAFTDTALSVVLINMITGGLYIVAPLVWSGALGWAGYDVGASINKSITSLTASSHSSGNKVGNKIT